MRRALALAVAAGLAALAGCATKFEYAPIDAATHRPYGYRDTHNADGGYTILVVMPAYSPNVDLAQQFWDRRAEELCGGADYRKTMFRAERPTVHYDNYGGRPGDYYLEGYLYCSAAAPTTEPAASPH
jgi:hypothetical protein